MNYEVLLGDCLDVLATMEAERFESCVTDPPYGLGFMGKDWDHGVPGVRFWKEVIRVMKPGAHLLAFGGTRTYHRLAVGIEDAGFEIRDTLAWLYGSGFPKSLNVSKAFDKAAGAERKIIGKSKPGRNLERDGIKGDMLIDEWHKESISVQITEPATELAKEWDGWGTALKPAFEPIILARKPFAGSVIQNVEKHRTGAINIDECRVETDSPVPINRLEGRSGFGEIEKPEYQQELNTKGRFPANVIHDGSEEVLEAFPDAGGGFGARGPSRRGVCNYGYDGKYETVGFGDSGSAARFFYCAKASQEDRDEGLFGFEKKAFGQSGGAQQALSDGEEEYQKSGEASVGLNVIKFVKNYHPTVKPTDLMRYLCRLITPPNGTVLDPFCGSGSTGKAAVLEGFDFVGVELNDEYADIARARIKAAAAQGRLF